MFCWPTSVSLEEGTVQLQGFGEFAHGQVLVPKLVVHVACKQHKTIQHLHHLHTATAYTWCVNLAFLRKLTFQVRSFSRRSDCSSLVRGHNNQLQA